MSTTQHPFAPEEIMAHLDGELPAERAHTVSTHIETCPDCRNLLQEFQQTKYNVTMWQVASLPAAIEDRVQSAAAKFPAASDTSSPEIFRRLRLWSWKRRLGVFAAVATAVVLLLSLTFSRNERLARRKAMPVDFARINSQLAQEQEALPASRPINGRKSKTEGLVTLTTPGVAADSNGLFHGLGDHAQNSFSLDGQPRTDQQSRVFSGPMIARTISLSLFTKDLESSRASLDAILVRHNGYAAELNVATPLDAARSFQASLRIPAPQLPAVLAELKSLGRVEVETQNGEEVTQQHADLVARLKNSRETEQRLQAILTDRTGKIKDVLEVEHEIARVRGEIEQMEAEQKNLEHRVDFATINLQLSEEYKAKLDSPTPSISTRLHNALVNGYRNVSDTLVALLLFSAEFGPILLFWALLLSIPVWFFWRRRRQALAL